MLEPYAVVLPTVIGLFFRPSLPIVIGIGFTFTHAFGQEALLDIGFLQTGTCKGKQRPAALRVGRGACLRHRAVPPTFRSSALTSAVSRA